MVTVICSMKKKFIGTSTETKPSTGLDIGDEWVNTDDGKRYVWDGSAWRDPTTAIPWVIGLAGFYIDHLLLADILTELPIVLGMSPRGLASDSTGVKHETGNILIPSWAGSMFSAAYLEVSILQWTGGTIALELYDGASVIDSLSFTATSYRSRSTKNILGSIVGKEVRGRLNVTTAGAAGSLAGDATYKIVFVR
ncbi:MAG: hypothetical protein QXM02_07800 [Thermoproteota archaeon]